ncbi:MAG TPA: hypothetical protein DCX46_07280 [Bacteroidetes bacterium]|nr:hypothetical protein [Bacteroidota bacterium]
MRAILVKSTATGALQLIVSTLLVFITIPTFVGKLGVEVYGVFSIVALVGNVNTFTNLGLNAALVRFLAQQGKSRQSDHDILASLIILLVILLPLTAAGYIFREAILLNIFNIPFRLIVDAEWLFVAMLVSNVFLLSGQIFAAILESMQKVYLTNIYQTLNNAVYWGLILVALSLGYSLQGVAVATLLSTLVWFCIVVASSLRAWGGLSISGFASNGVRAAKKQLRYGLQIYSGSVISFLYEPLTKILVARFLGVTEVGLFDIGVRARNQVMGMVGKLVYPIYPLLSQESNPERVRDIVHDVEQKILYAVLPLVGIVLLTSKPLISMMFDSHVDTIAITVACVVSAYLLGSFTVTPNYQYLLAKGYASKTVLLQAINVVVNAGAFFLFLPWLGYYAVVAANVAAILTSCGVSVYYQHRYLNSLILDSWRQTAYLCASFLVACALGNGFSELVDAHAWKLAGIPIVVMGVTLFQYRLFGMVTRKDIARYFGGNSLLSKWSAVILCR